MHLLILSFHVYLPDGAIIQYKYLRQRIFIARPNCRYGKYTFTQESFYLQGTHNDTNEQDTSFPDCKHKHMMKSGIPPDKVGVLYSLLLIEFHGFTTKLDF